MFLGYRIAIPVRPLILVLLFFVSPAGPIFSQSAPSAGPSGSDPIQAPVAVNGQTLFYVGGPDPQIRAQRINARLKTLVTRDSDVANFRAEQQGGNYVLVVGDIPVMTVTSSDAQDALMGQDALAREWGQTLTDSVKQARAERRSWTRRVLNPVRRSMDQLLDQILEALPRFLSAILLLALTHFLARGVRAGVRPIVRRAHMDDNLRQLAYSIFFYGAWGLGLVMTGSVLGLQTASVITALGVSGFVLGFAFQDILKHFLAGILLLAGRTFQIGDQISVKECEGTVEQIDLRATHVRTYDNRLVIVPNADVFSSVVVNNTESRVRRQEFDVVLHAEADLAGAQLLAFDTMKATKGVLEDPPPDVLVAELNVSGVTLRCRFWSDSRRANVLAVGSEVRRRVKETLERERVPLATSTTALVMSPPARDALAQALTKADRNGEGSAQKADAGLPVAGESPRTAKSETEATAQAKEALPKAPTAEMQ